MTTERDIESAIVIQLLRLGWQADPRKQGQNVFRQSPKTRDERGKLGGKKPDFILYADPESGRATVVIEAKRPNKSLLDALEQGKGYAASLAAPIVVATDGYRLKTWHMDKKAPLFFNNAEADELFSAEMALHYAGDNRYESFLRYANITKQDLIKRFAKANGILRQEGLDAGIVRFSEFANLMFLKLRLEGGGSIAGHKWPEIRQKKGGDLLDAVKVMLNTLNEKHSGLFEPTAIRTPRRMEQLVEILSSFSLTSVRDDIKGMAFEHFIHSYTQGASNDLGQYFTPRHIIKMMVHFLKPSVGEKIHDPFCGTGGMLIECFRYISQHIDSPRDIKALREGTLYGRDNSSVARIARMNMIMFGDGHANIERGDTYEHHAKDKGKYDAVITNIPFSQTTEHYESYPVRPVGDANGDSIGVQYCLESLKDDAGARAAIVVPVGFVYKRELKAEREHILRNFELERVVELTPKCFNPYTEQQTAVLFLRRGRGKTRGGAFSYYQVKEDGYSQDGYRIPLSGENDLDKTMEEGGGKTQTAGEKSDFEFKQLDIICRKGEVPLAELAAVRKGDGISPKTMPHYTMGGDKPVLMVADLSKSHIDYSLDESKFRINSHAIADKKPFLYPVNTVVLPTSGKATLLNHRALLGKATYMSSTLTGIVAKEGTISPYCLFYFFLGFDAEAVVYDLGYPGLGVGVLKQVPVPNYSDKRQEEIEQEVGELVNLWKKAKGKHRKLLGE